jgi:hypothetical protein
VRRPAGALRQVGRQQRQVALPDGLGAHRCLLGVLTGKGRDLCDLLMAMVRFGDRWLAGQAGPPVLYRHHACGQIATVELHCGPCDAPMDAGSIDVLPGPGSGIEPRS